MIFLFTDFGREGPYIGQMEAVLRRHAPAVPVIHLFADAPAFDPQASAYLLAAYTQSVCEDDVVLCVVDPGVGTTRDPIVLRADGRWFVGPENGLLSIVARRAALVDLWKITWRPQHLSASFHGRDLFAPVAAALAAGGLEAAKAWLARMDTKTVLRPGWPDQHGAVVYIDRYGNVVTGIAAESVGTVTEMHCGAHILKRAATFGDVMPGHAFWYANSSGLVEIAVNKGNAAEMLDLRLGAPVLF